MHRVFGDESQRRPAHHFAERFGRGPRQRGLPRSLPASELHLELPCDDPKCISRDACDRLLPSTSQSRAPVPRSLPKRSRLPRARFFGLACGARLKGFPPVGGRSKSPAFSRRRARFSVPRRFAIYFIARTWRRFLPPSFAIGRASDAPVAPPALRRLERSLSQRPTPENDAEIVGRRFREETAALRPSASSVGRCFFISTTSCDAAPRSHTGLGPLAASLLGSHGFAAVGPGTTPFQTGSIPPRFFRAMVAAGPRLPFTSRLLFDARRFFEPECCLSTSATSFQVRRTDTFSRARSSPAAGDCPARVAARRCAFRCSPLSPP